MTQSSILEDLGGPLSEKDKANFPRLQFPSEAPVVQVVAQAPVSNAKLQLLQELLIVKDVQRVENIVSPVAQGNQLPPAR